MLACLLLLLAASACLFVLAWHKQANRPQSRPVFSMLIILGQLQMPIKRPLLDPSTRLGLGASASSSQPRSSSSSSITSAPTPFSTTARFFPWNLLSGDGRDLHDYLSSRASQWGRVSATTDPQNHTGRTTKQRVDHLALLNLALQQQQQQHADASPSRLYTFFFSFPSLPSPSAWLLARTAEHVPREVPLCMSAAAGTHVQE